MFGTILGILITVLTLATGCGKAPDLSLTTDTTAKAAAVTQTFTYAQFTQICDALKTWDSSKTNIQFPANNTGSVVWYFSATGVTQNGLSTPSVSVSVGAFPFACTVLVDGGKIVSYQ